MNVNIKSTSVIKTTMIILINTFSVDTNHEKKPGLIYILTWTSPGREPFNLWSSKQKSIISNNCSYQNCYIVKDRDYFQDAMDYDVILFNPSSGFTDDLPSARSDNQYYVFTCVEPSAYLPLGESWNWFFNYTWTYKLDSDVIYPYFFVRNRRNEIVGPKINAHWRSLSIMKPTKDSIVERLKNKTIAAAWFVTRCYALNNRGVYGHSVRNALVKYNLTVDFFGACGNKFCPRDRAECGQLLQTSYYFYLAFENSNCEDYVTEKLMTALENYAVPVVLGGADYTRFLPYGSYLNGNTLSVEQLADKINEAVYNKQIYYDYFRWHRYYTYRRPEGGSTDPLCTFCAFLNKESVKSQRRVYAYFTKWWNEYSSKNKSDEFIVTFDDSSHFIRSVVTYREKKIEKAVDSASTEGALDKVNSFFDDLIGYYFQ